MEVERAVVDLYRTFLMKRPHRRALRGNGDRRRRLGRCSYSSTRRSSTCSSASRTSGRTTARSTTTRCASSRRARATCRAGRSAARRGDRRGDPAPHGLREARRRGSHRRSRRAPARRPARGAPHLERRQGARARLAARSLHPVAEARMVRRVARASTVVHPRPSERGHRRADPQKASPRARGAREAPRAPAARAPEARAAEKGKPGWSPLDPKCRSAKQSPSWTWTWSSNVPSPLRHVWKARPKTETQRTLSSLLLLFFRRRRQRRKDVTER